MWQRLCLAADCGMDELRARADHSGEWMYHVDRTPLILHQAFVGTPILFRFTTESALYKVDPESEALVRRQTLPLTVDLRCCFTRASQ
jgi:hypothetical protein